MADLNERLKALSPERRLLLTERLRQAQPAAEIAVPRPAGEGGLKPSGTGLKFSLFFFASAQEGDPREQYELLLECARFADSHDFEALWVPERHFDQFGAPYPSPAVLAAAVAAVTSRLRIRAGSVVLPLHDPILVAEEWAMLDNLSGGRVGVSFASGWHADDFVLAPDAYHSRRELLLDRLDTVRRLWARQPIVRLNGTGRPIEITAYPAPLRPALPMWITSSSRLETWLTGARHGLNVLTGLMEQTVDEVAGKVSAYHAELDAGGHDPQDFEVTAMVHTFIGDSDAEVRATVHDPLVGYLRSHLELFSKLAASQDLGIDLGQITASDKAALAERGFERYYTTHGLFGTPDSARPMVDRLRSAGVTEIACLVDFGVEPATVLRHLEHLARLKVATTATAGDSTSLIAG